MFDAPSVKKPYEERVKYLKSVIKSEKQSTYAAVVRDRSLRGASVVNR